jgi:hypothetical protein
VETTDAHTVLIEWGDTGATTTLNLGAGVLQFTATHTYPDDNPTGTDLKTITVTVTDNGQSGAPPANDFKNVIATTDVTVNNVAPSNTGSTFTFNPYTGAASASISFSDPGLLDPITAIWAGLVPTTPTTLAAPRPLTGAFGASNTFDGTGCFATPISVTVSDDDTGSFSYQFAPANSLGVYTVSFMAPIKDGARNIVKLGNVIPVKIQLLDCHGNPVLNRTLTVWVVSGIIAPEDIVEGDLTIPASVSAADTGNQMRIADDHYMFNLATKGLKVAPFTIVIRDSATGTLNIATAAIELKK